MIALFLCVICCVILPVTTLFLAVRIHLLHKSFLMICEDLTDILEEGADTNALLTVVSGDPALRKMTACLNRQLRQLRRKQLRYENGDRELKEAITNISHDLRTPLTAISGYLDLLNRELTPTKENEKARRHLVILRNRTEAMKQLTDELFRYSVALSIRSDAPVTLSLNRILEESLISFCSDLDARGITPVIHMPDATVFRTLDRSYLTRVFGNIISNAVKYSDGDFRVTLTEEGVITFSNKASGLTPVTTAKLFDRYFTVETVADSAASRPSSASGGLGLSIARLLTERMGGSIDAAYKTGELYISVRFPG